MLAVGLGFFSVFSSSGANNNDLTLLKKLIKVLETPYEKQQENIDYQSPAPIGDKKYANFLWNLIIIL